MEFKSRVLPLYPISSNVYTHTHTHTHTHTTHTTHHFNFLICNQKYGDALYYCEAIWEGIQIWESG